MLKIGACLRVGELRVLWVGVSNDPKGLIFFDNGKAIMMNSVILKVLKERRITAQGELAAKPTCEPCVASTILLGVLKERRPCISTTCESNSRTAPTISTLCVCAALPTSFQDLNQTITFFTLTSWLRHSVHPVLLSAAPSELNPISAVVKFVTNHKCKRFAHCWSVTTPTNR